MVWDSPICNSPFQKGDPRNPNHQPKLPINHQVKNAIGIPKMEMTRHVDWKLCSVSQRSLTKKRSCCWALASEMADLRASV